jgi:hypothetical protein
VEQSCWLGFACMVERTGTFQLRLSMFKESVRRLGFFARVNGENARR